MDNHLFRQAREGEFALLQDEARGMTAQEFADMHGAKVQSGVQDCVHIGGCDYFWSGKTGKYDGWGRSV